jgi:hypothetical protein
VPGECKVQFVSGQIEGFSRTPRNSEIPSSYEVRQSDEETKQLMNQWVFGGNSKNIPKDARHLMLISGILVQFRDSLLNVTLLM